MIPAGIRFFKTHLPHLFPREHPFHHHNLLAVTMTTGQISRYKGGQIGSSLHSDIDLLPK
jgi:hypothetical protein